MDSFYRQIGYPPYRLDQIQPLLDEASALISNPEKNSAQYRDTAMKTAESLEELTWRVDFCLMTTFPQFVVTPDPVPVEKIEARATVCVPRAERDILDSIGPKVLRLRDCLLDGPNQSSRSSRSRLGTAQLCQCCNYPFEELARGLVRGSHTVPGLFSSRPPGILLAIDHWPDLPVLEERSLQGCEFCRFLRKQLFSLFEERPEASDGDRHRVHVWINFSLSRDSKSLRWVKVELGGYSPCSGKSLYFTIDTTNDHVADKLGIFRSPATTSLDPANVDFIKFQLALSEDIVATSGYRPKRLLDIGISTQPELRLIDGKKAEVGVRGLRYATLSYCWGPAGESKHQLKLTAKTQCIFYRSIPLGLITPVLRDAVILCRLLGLRYLWIDSLCIQQDGYNTDWEEQSQEMSHIFGNSWLTICATAANSCLEGFLSHTDRHSDAIEIAYVAKDGQEAQGSFFLRLLSLNGKPGFRDDIRFALLSPFRRDLECSEWNRRGWVFQERILSPRLLYFGARMIHFQHGDHMASENGSSFDGDFFDPDIDRGRHCATNLLHQLQRIQNQGAFISDFWYRLVTTINPSNFTDRRDTLPAIAGIARRVHEFSKHQYLAGLWEEDLCCGLLWMPNGTTNPLISRYIPTSLRQLLLTIKKQSIAPSWSWASRRSFLEFRITNQTTLTCRVRRHLRADFEALQSRVLVDGVNVYGRISSASISLSGSMIRLTPNLLTPGLFVSDQMCEIFPKLFAFVQTDWRPVKFKATGIKQQMQAQFHLLLIASCCSDWSRSNNTRTAQSGPHNERAESEAGPAKSPHAGGWSSNKMTEGKMWEEAYKPDYRKSFYEDSYSGFDPAVHCDLCSDQTLVRDIWGLLIYPAGPVDTFYRVGTFFSRAAFGGSAIFEGVEPRRIILV